MKKIVLIFILVLAINTVSYCTSADEIIKEQSDALNLSGLVETTKKYTSDAFPSLDYNKLLENAIAGKTDNSTIFSGVSIILGKEIKSAIGILGTVLIIVIIHSIFKSIVENLGNNNSGNIAYFVQYILIVIVLMNTYSQVLQSIKETITVLTDFIYMLIPLLLSLLIATGNIISTSIIQPVLLFAITFIGKFISSIVLPILLIATTLGIVSNLSDKIKLDKLSKYLKSTILWFLCIFLTVFTAILSLETSLSKGVDEVTAKTSKAAVSSFVPVVGKILGDTVETVLGCAGILKNAVGFIGLIGVIGICIIPVIRVGILTITYYLASGLCEVIADAKIVKVLEQMGDTFKILFAILSSISLILIIGITIVIKMSIAVT